MADTQKKSGLQPGGTQALGGQSPQAPQQVANKPAEKDPLKGVTGQKTGDLAQDLKTTGHALFLQSPSGQLMVKRNQNDTYSLFKASFGSQLGMKSGEQPEKYELSYEEMLKFIPVVTKNQFSVIMKESKEMKNTTNIIKKDLLRRKIQEHFSSHPKSSSVIISSNIGGNKTVWKVDKTKRGYNVVEVNTHKEQFIIEAGPLGGGTSMPLGSTPAGGSTDFQQVTKIMEPIFGNLGTTQAQAAQARNKVNGFMSKLKNPSEKSQAGAYLSYLGALTGGEMTRTSPETPISTAPGAVPTPSTKTGLTSSKKYNGKKLHEAEEEKDKKDDDDESDKKPEPKDSDVEVGNDSAPEMEPTEDPLDAGMETGDVPPVSDEVPAEDETPEQSPKTGEEVQLKQLVKTKPIQNIDVFGDNHGGHILLSLGGMKNPLQLNFGHDGKITYKLGELSRVLKVGK